MANKLSLCSTGSWVKRGAIAAIFGAISVLATSCGGGGTQGPDPVQGGNGTTLAILPAAATLYANQPVTFTVAGGRGPYFLASSEPSLVPLGVTISGNTFTIVPAQPGVVDPQTDPLAVPSRKLIITVRDSAGTQVDGTYNVLQNFATGYSLSISSISACGATATTTSRIAACAGSDSLIQLVPITNGIRYANKQMRLSVTFGPFSFILDSQGTTGGTLTTVADSAGLVTARIRVLPNAATQYAQFRLTDVATGAYSDETFIVTNVTGNSSALTLLPNTITITGPNSAVCGTGALNVFVFGGQPPYTAAASAPSVSVTPPTLNNSGDVLTITANSQNTCLTNSPVLITDSTGARATFTMNTAVGTVAPILPLLVAPNSVCVPDSGSAVISVSGGANTKVINSGNPALATAVPTSNSGDFTFAINAAGLGGPVGTVFPMNITDGVTNGAVAVTRKQFCP